MAIVTWPEITWPGPDQPIVHHDEMFTLHVHPDRLQAAQSLGANVKPIDRATNPDDWYLERPLPVIADYQPAIAPDTAASRMGTRSTVSPATRRRAS